MTDIQPTRSEGIRGRRRRLLWLALAVAGVLASAGGYVVWHALATRHDRAAVRLLRSGDPEARRRGAWLSVQGPTPQATRLIAQQLSGERDPNVRESYVYALGRGADPRRFELVAKVARDDPEPYVRQAAWLAAARIDALLFRDLAVREAAHDDPWDRIGLAHAWLEVGDLRGVDDLLRWAVDGTPTQRQVASLALTRGVGPLLDAAGRWPIGFNVREGESWPTELVAEVRRRCEALDLEAIAADTRPHALRAAAVRRNVGRVHGARGRLARLLFAP